MSTQRSWSYFPKYVRLIKRANEVCAKVDKLTRGERYGVKSKCFDNTSGANLRDMARINNG